jgi:hypothetical protein
VSITNPEARKEGKGARTSAVIRNPVIHVMGISGYVLENTAYWKQLTKSPYSLCQFYQYNSLCTRKQGSPVNV